MAGGRPRRPTAGRWPLGADKFSRRLLLSASWTTRVSPLSQIRQASRLRAGAAIGTHQGRPTLQIARQLPRRAGRGHTLLLSGRAAQLVHSLGRHVEVLRAGITIANDAVVEISGAGMSGPPPELGGVVVLLGLLQRAADQLAIQEVSLLRRQLGAGTQGGVDQGACLGHLAAVVLGAARAQVLGNDRQ